VEDLSLRTLKIRADNGMLQTIPFGSITVIGNKSRYFSYIIINFSAHYDADPEKIQQLLEKAYQILRRTSGMNKKILAPIEIRGITDISDYAIIFQARLKTAPGQQDIVRRAYNKILKQLCDEAGVRVPSPSYPGFQQKQPSLTNTVLP
jgi:small conductance mechanosensitive channel